MKIVKKMDQKQKNEITINLPTSFIIKVVAILFLVYFLYLIKLVVFIFFLAFVLATAIEPTVDFLEKKQIPRSAGVVIIYLFLLAFFTFFIYLVLNPVVAQLGLLANNFPLLWQKFVYLFTQFKFYLTQTGLTPQTQNFLLYLENFLSEQIFNLLVLLKNIFQIIFYFFVVLILTFLIVIDKNFWQRFFASFFPRSYQPYLLNLISSVKKKIGDWLRGQLSLCFIIFVLVYAGLSLLGVKYALLLALFSGLAEFIPLIGPLIGELPAVFLTFFQSPTLALWVVIFYFVVQQFDANILAPKIMGRALGLSPVVIILAILAGATLGGVLGIISAVPAVAIFNLIIKDFFSRSE